MTTPKFPADWSVKSLAAIPCEVIDCHHSTPVWTSSGHLVIRNQNIRNGKLDLAEQSYTDALHFQERIRRAKPTAGDIVITREAPMGQVCMIPKDLQCCLGQRMVLLRITSVGAHGNYVLYALQSEAMQKYIAVTGGTGSTVSNLRIPVIKALSIPLPSDSEQRAIATALSDVDALIAGLEKLIAKKRDLQQAAMQQLLTGQTRLPGFSGDWVHKQLGDVIREISDGGTPSTSDSRNFGGDVPWVVIDDIQQKIVMTRTTLTEKGLQACAARLWPQGALIVSTGATIGEVGILQVSAATKQGICGIIFDLLLATPEYMQYWFVNNRKLLLSKAQGSSIKEVRAPTLVTLSLSIPGIDEQTAIAGILDDMDSDISTCESRLAKTRELKQGMMQELLTGNTRLI
jgi:type I restriction enzyme, S subunit